MGRATTSGQTERPLVDEYTYRTGNVHMCLIVNRRVGLIRVIDFRAGAVLAKRLYVQSVARREGVQKVITLVEKDEVASWKKVGFVPEGTIPAFYKRSDGHLCGCVVGDTVASEGPGEQALSAADETVKAARQKAAMLPSRPRIQLEPVEAQQALRARDQACARKEAIGTFDPFGRYAQRCFWRFAPRGRTPPNFLSAEYQECFGHALIELLRSPRTEAETAAAAEALRRAHDHLRSKGIVSTFVFAPLQDANLGAALMAAGYKRSGVLALGAWCGGKRTDAILWTSKLAGPEG